MNSKNKKFLLTRERHEIIIVRSSKTHRSFCAWCAAETDFLTLDEAVGLCGLRTRKILSEIETRAIHSQETASGHLFVCPGSLETFINGNLEL